MLWILFVVRQIFCLQNNVFWQAEVPLGCMFHRLRNPNLHFLCLLQSLVLDYYNIIYTLLVLININLTFIPESDDVLRFVYVYSVYTVVLLILISWVSLCTIGECIENKLSFCSLSCTKDSMFVFCIINSLYPVCGMHRTPSIRVLVVYCSIYI